MSLRINANKQNYATMAGTPEVHSFERIKVPSEPTGESSFIIWLIWLTRLHN